MINSNQSLFDPKEAEILNEVQDVRYRIVKTLTENDELPESDEDRQFLLKAMDGLERTILTKAKIKSDDRQNQAREDVIEMVASVLKKINFQNEGKAVEGNRALQLDSSMQITDIVPGEMDIGIKSQSYEEFMKKF